MSKTPLFNPRAIEKENAYGHKKRLEFIFQTLANYKRDVGIKKEDQFQILDVGCGTGIMITIPVAEAGYSIIGIDTDQQSICQAQALNVTKNASFTSGLVESRLDSWRKQFDIIICSEVLEHLEEPVNLLNSLRDVMKDEGRIILTIPNGYGWFELEQFFWNILRLDKVYPFGLRVWEYLKKRVTRKNIVHAKSQAKVPGTLNVDSQHIQRFTQRSFVKTVEQSGLQIVKQKNATIFCGKFTHNFLGNSRKFIEWNRTFSDKLNPIFVSDWYYELKKKALFQV